MIQRRVRRARIGEIASAVNFSAVDEGLPIPDNVSRRSGRVPQANEGQVDALDGRFWSGDVSVLRVSAS